MDQTTSVPHKPGINWKFEFQQYGTALLITAVTFIIYSVYADERSGGAFDTFAVNRALADLAAILLSFVLLLGPVNRLFNRYDKFLQYRKELGILMAFAAILHAVMTFFFLNTRFPKADFLADDIYGFMFGLLATTGLVLLVFISNKAVMRMVGVKTWARWQSWGARLIFTLMALHVAWLRLPGWIDFYQGTATRRGLHPEWPSAGMLVGLLLAFVILVRLAEWTNPKLGKAASWLLVIGWPIAVAVTFVVGRKYLP